MKITVSGSAKKLDELEKLRDELTAMGFDVHVPTRSSDYQLGDYELRKELIDEHLNFMRDCDVFLIGNIKSPDEKFGHVGLSTYFETGWAYALGKPIFALNEIDPGSEMAEDLLSLGIIILNGNFNKLREGI